MSAIPAILVIIGFKPRAFAGQIETQRMQPIHFDLSTERGLEESIAPAGHTLAQAPQFVQVLFALGTIAAPAFL